MTTDNLPEPLPEIQLSPLAYTFGHWLSKTYRAHHQDPFDLDAPYQRGSVWTVEQRRALIKSLYMGVPIGSIVVSVLDFQTDGRDYRILDGKQRIEATRAWVDDEFTCPAWWFRSDDTTTREGDLYYSQLTDQGRRHFEMSTHMPALQFDGRVMYLGRRGDGSWKTRKRTPAELLAAEAELYGLINGGGTPQTEENMANAARFATVEGVENYEKRFER